MLGALALDLVGNLSDSASPVAAHQVLLLSPLPSLVSRPLLTSFLPSLPSTCTLSSLLQV